MQSAPITTNIVSSNPAHATCTRYNIMVMMFNATFNNISVISWRSVLLVEETRVPIEKYRSVASYWQTLSHNVVSSTCRHEGSSLSFTYLFVIVPRKHEGSSFYYSHLYPPQYWDEPTGNTGVKIHLLHL
jgi:hypothetical protein